MDEKSAHEKAAAAQPHDAHGYFAPKTNLPQQAQPQTNPINNFVDKEVSIKHTNIADDTLVDVHVNNPLKKITKILESIKKQKAFSFDIKGSLGFAGVVLVITTFGIFGGTKAFCSKGEQSHIGTLTALVLEEQNKLSIFDRVKTIWDAAVGKEIKPILPHPRIILIEQSQTIYHVAGLLKSQGDIIKDIPYIVTGEVDACSQTITVKDPNAIQIKL